MAKSKAKKLALWYAHHARELPWRRTADPYALWVSEIMLQQTQVATVLPYYERWMKRFPTVMTLAKANLDDVMKCWEGLGYYARVRRMHQAAQQLAKNGWPKSAEEWATLPGVGPSTANALASFLFEEPAPVLDGNVQRVLTRLHGLEIPLPPKSVDKKQLESLARTLIEQALPSIHNQAMMELGATVCVPTSPKCPACPWQTECVARSMGREQQLPIMQKKAKKKVVQAAVGLLVEKEKLLVLKRPEEGLLGGLYELPGGKLEGHEDAAEALVREFQEETGLKVSATKEVTVVKHEFTHFTLFLHAYFVTRKGGKLNAEAKRRQAQWAPVSALSALAFPSATLKIFKAAGWS